MTDGMRFTAQLSVRGIDGREIQGDGTVVLGPIDVGGERTHALQWDLKNRRESSRNTVYLAQIVGLAATDDRTVVIRYNDYEYTYGGGTAFNPVPTSRRPIACQVAIRHRDANVLAARIAERMAEAAERESDFEHGLDNDPNGQPLSDSEVTAIQALLGPADRADDPDDEVECYEATFTFDDDQCRAAWAHYRFEEMDSDTGSSILCARCIRMALADGALPDGVGRWVED